jgi:predicted pyridoxine 5'-phosphate oxidase superfamily flavin-nucleotide-binding protein
LELSDKPGLDDGPIGEERHGARRNLHVDVTGGIAGHQLVLGDAKNVLDRMAVIVAAAAVVAATVAPAATVAVRHWYGNILYRRARLVLSLLISKQ